MLFISFPTFCRRSCWVFVHSSLSQISKPKDLRNDFEHCKFSEATTEKYC